jgi:hypothetical protein
MAVKDREQANTLSIDILVTDVCIFHAQAPALHRGERVSVSITLRITCKVVLLFNWLI